jgi:hypothetical protein
MTHYQICFTRIGAQGSGDGWQSVNASPALTSETMASFSRFQNGNIYPPAFDAEDAAAQTVTELQSDGGFAFLTKIKYGLKDQTGRPAMFAHSFVFPLGEFVKNPQNVLCVADSNFAFDIEGTASPRPVLARSAALSLGDAVKALALTEDSYTTLVRCVYFVLDGKTKNALHIVCDCRPETIQNIMTCVFAAVPFEFRKKITYSTYENQNGTPKAIIFNRLKSAVNGFFVDPQTGENNVLTEVLLKRWEKYEFMKEAPLNPSADIDGYFRALENTLSLFGSAQTTSLDLYKIAHDLMLDDKNGGSSPAPEALSKRLNEFLSIPISHPYIDQQIQYVLSDIVDRKVVLNDVLCEKLCRKLENTQDQDLIQVGYLYNSEKIGRMSVEEGGLYLFTAYENRKSDSFIQIRKLLDRDAKGIAILNYLYTKLVFDSLPQDRDHILEFHEETAVLYDRREIQRSLCLLCYACLKAEIDGKTDPSVLMRDAEALLRKVLRDRPDLASRAMYNLVDAYWESFSYESLQIDQRELYRGIWAPDNAKAQLVFALLETYYFFVNGDAVSFQNKVAELFQSKRKAFTETERAIVIKKLQTACLRNRDIYGSHELDAWMTLAFLQCLESKNPVEFLIDNRISAMLRFETAYPESRTLQSEENLTRFVGYLETYMQNKPEGYKIAAEALRVIKDAQKRAKQDEKRQNREQRQEPREDPDRKAPFHIKGLFRKNSQDDNN